MPEENKPMKKFLAFALCLALLAGLVPCAGYAADRPVTIVTTIFPIYDWVRRVAGESKNTSLVLLLDNGVDLHSYQPSARDIMTISTADLFIYVGGESDEWVEDALAAAMNPDLVSISLTEALGTDLKAEKIVEGMEHEHDHEDGDHDHDHEDRDQEEEEEEYDEHVWLSLRNAQKLVGVIAGALAGINPDRAETIRSNAAEYTAQLDALDRQYTEAVESAAYRTLLFGDRFPFRYLADDYGLTYYAAFAGCSAESEASFETIAFLARKVNELGLPAVMAIEGANHRIAETVISTAAGLAGGSSPALKLLTMDSMQSVNAEDVRQGASYLTVMEANLTALKEALN